MTLHHRFWRTTAAVLVLLSLLLLFLIPRYAFAADGVVGDGSPASCTEGVFNTVLATVQSTGGGTITFNCGAAPHTIAISGYKQISTTVTIDGANLITFNGGGTSSFFQVFNVGKLTLTNMTFENGAFNGIAPLENFGQLTLANTTVKNNVSTRAAVLNQAGGLLSVTDSTFEGNGITGTAATGGGAAISNESAIATIVGSVFAGNTVTGTPSFGGAVVNDNGTVTVSDTRFSNNYALDGGGIYATGTSTTTVENSTFSNNRAGYGAGIEGRGTRLIVHNTSFTNNTAQGGDGGAIWTLAGDLDVVASSFVGNTAGTTGGAISCYDNFISVINSTFANNEAGTTGGGLYSGCSTNLTNNTFSGNSAGESGGGIHQNGGSANAQYLTIANNSATFGAGIYNEGASGGSFTIGKSIVAFNSTGNCDGVISSDGYNLTNDTGCGAFIQPGDMSNANVPLSALGNFGGPTQTRLPQAGSDAINHIPGASCGFGTDQRGIARPQNADCDSGAVELTASDNPSLDQRLYLPLIRG